jgi:hypothetical protein
VSRYLVLVILNMPFILAALVNTLVSYKLGRISKQRFILRTAFWLFIFAGLVLAQPVYNYLFSRDLTTSASLTIFDIVEITGLVVVFLIANRSRTRIDTLERRVQDLHQELSIRLSDQKKP